MAVFAGPIIKPLSSLVLRRAISGSRRSTSGFAKSALSVLCSPIPKCHAVYVVTTSDILYSLPVFKMGF